MESKEEIVRLVTDGVKQFKPERMSPQITAIRAWVGSCSRKHVSVLSFHLAVVILAGSWSWLAGDSTSLPRQDTRQLKERHWL